MLSDQPIMLFQLWSLLLHSTAPHCSLRFGMLCLFLFKFEVESTLKCFLTFADGGKDRREEWGINGVGRRKINAEREIEKKREGEVV